MIVGGTAKEPVLAFYYSDCYLSNCFIRNYESPERGIVFNCSQQHYQYEKAQHFGDKKTAEMILKSKNPRMQKFLGRQVRGYSDQEWDKKRVEIMYRVILTKFQACPELRKRLLEDVKPNYIIAESGPVGERFWGTGRPLHSNGACNPDEWEGENMLGNILKQVYTYLSFQKSREQKD